MIAPAVVRALVGGQQGGTPTATQFGAYRAMFGHFNRDLFAGTLPEPILNFSRASKRIVAFFAPNRWEGSEGERAHEISLNPAYLGKGAARETSQSFVHEMAHLWQQIHGKPSRRGYHNIEWSRKMMEIGLQPIDAKTGRPAMSAHGMSDRIIEGGAFSRAFATLPAEALLPWTHVGAVLAEPQGDDGAPCAVDEPPAPTRNKVKYTCAACGANAWGKPGLVILCLGGSGNHDPELLEATR